MTRPSLINFRKGDYSHNVYYVVQQSAHGHGWRFNIRGTLPSRWHRAG